MELFGDLSLMNNEIKYFKVDNVSIDPTAEELTESRVWYNTTEKYLKYFDGNDIKIIGTNDANFLGVPSDGEWNDGLLVLTADTRTSDAVDDINEILGDLAPAQPINLNGNLIPSVAVAQGYISDSTNPLYDYNKGDLGNVTKFNTFNLNLPTPTTQFGKADEGELKFVINGIEVDQFDLKSNFNEDYRNSEQIYTPKYSPNNYIKITNISKYNNFRKWQKGSAVIEIGNIPANVLTGGEYTFSLKHETPSNTYTTNDYKLYYDNETHRPSIGEIPTLVENTPNFKYMSGVKFYNQGSSFNLNAIINYAFEYTYVNNPVNISLPGLTSFDMPYTDSSITGVSTIPKFNDIININDKELTLSSNNTSSLDARVVLIPKDPHGNGTSAQSVSEGRMIYTYPNNSTELMDDFQDETFRLPIGQYNEIPSTLNNQWNSEEVIVNGNAQVFMGSLVYPSMNFSLNRLPQQNIDYSSFNGNQEYYRAFRKNNSPKTNGKLAIYGITQSDLNTNVKIEIKLPSQTGWLDCSKLFNVGTYTGADGDGCVTSFSLVNGTLNINWSSGTYSTAFSGYMYIIRITLLNAVKSITKIEEIGW